jgi:hypothetical protein
MSKCKGFFLAASAVLFFAAVSHAADKALLALNAVPAQEPAVKEAPLQQAATAQFSVPATGETDFDALSAAGDPLFREGSKELLKEAARQDGLKEQKAAPAPAPRDFRDAPAGKAAVPAAVPASVIGKPKAKKPVHADPVQAKDTL